MNVAANAKAIVALGLTVAYFALSEGLIPDSWLPYVRVVFSVAIVYGVWAVPNRPKVEGRHAAGD